MRDIEETKSWRINGFLALVVEVALGLLIWQLTKHIHDFGKGGIFGYVVLWIAAALALRGFFVVHPNEAKVLIFFGNYAGSVRLTGWHWSNPSSHGGRFPCESATSTARRSR